VKDLLLFLMSYPFWVKAVIVTLLSICALVLIAFKPNLPETPVSPPPAAVVNAGVNQGGNVAGRDIIVNTGPIGAQTEELIRVLQARAQRIERDLKLNFKYVEAKSFLDEFRALHEAHIEALRRNNLVEAHEYLKQIYEVSRSLEGEEFWAKHRKETPGRMYSLSREAFHRGKMIQWYTGEKAQELLVAEAVRARYPRDASTKPLVNLAEIYAHILSSL
jgi:hypothetical protein